VPGLRTTFGDCVSLVGWAVFICIHVHCFLQGPTFRRVDGKLFVAGRSADRTSVSELRRAEVASMVPFVVGGKWGEGNNSG
jgi:hypothetical protein